MAEKKPHLSMSELAAIDLMIAHMQKTKQPNLGGFIDSIISAVEVAATAVSAAASVVAATAARAAVAAANGVAEAAPAIAEVAEVAAAAGVSKATPEELNALIKELNKNGLESFLTLENLMDIRKKHTK